MRIKLLSIIALMLTAVSAWAEEFVVDGINYQTNSDDETTVSVVYKTPKYEGDIVIPASVTYDGKTYGVTSIGGYAFYECSSLTSINIPDGVTSIGWDAFYGCSSLTRVDYGGTIADWLKINFSSADCYPLRYAHHLYIDGKEVTEVVIPDGVTSIGDHAFEGCSSLTSITIPSSVTSIGSGAFYGCSSLTSITIPNSVTSIGWAAFSWCSSLTSITIPDGVKSIGYVAFSWCRGLTSITIPSSVTSIGWAAFSGCSNLKQVATDNTNVSMIESALGTDRTYIVPCTLYDQYVAAGLTTTKQHDLAKTEAVAATCTETGLTEGSHCEACHATIMAQTTTDAIGHLFIDYIYNNDATTAADGTETAHCDHNCGTTDTRTAEGTKLSIPTGVGQVSGDGQKVIKTIEDGRIVIIRDGVKYDITGRKL